MQVYKGVLPPPRQTKCAPEIYLTKYIIPKWDENIENIVIKLFVVFV